MNLHKLAVDVLNTVRQCSGEMPLAYIEAACRESHQDGIRQGREEAARARWLIEAAESEAARPLYWRGSFGDERNLWTYDHMTAVRLARKADAEAIAAGVLRGYAIRICEHVWDGVVLR